MNNETKLSKKETQVDKKAEKLKLKEAKKLAKQNKSNSKNTNKSNKSFRSKFTTTKAKNSNKIEHDKSELAKKLNIRISNPYGYYPEDVDPIIIKLQEEISNLTKENKSLSDEVYKLTKDLGDLRTEYSKFRMHASLGMVEVPIPSTTESLENISKIDDITGNQHDNQIPALASLLSDDEEDNSINIEPQINTEDTSNTKPKIKFKLNIGGNHNV